MEKTSTGIPANVAGLLCYALVWLSGLIFILIERRSKFVRYHAQQSIVIFGALTVVLVIGNFLGNIPDIGLTFAVFIIPPVSLLWLVLWPLLMVEAYRGRGVWLKRT